jgi:hypothetical protein
VYAIWVSWMLQHEVAQEIRVSLQDPRIAQRDVTSSGPA